MRLVFVNPSSQIGGAEVALINFTKYFPDKSNIYVILFEQGPLGVELQRAGAKVYILELSQSIVKLSRQNLSGIFRAIIDLPGEVCKILKVINLISPDLIITNGIKAHILIGIASLFKNIPYLIYLRDRLSAPLFRCIISFFARRSKGVVANSNQTLKSLNLQGSNIKTYVVHNGVDLTRFKNDKSAKNRARKLIKRRFNIKARVFIGTIGHISPLKNFEEFIELAEKFKDKEDIVFFIIGGTVYKTSQNLNFYMQRLKIKAKDLLNSKKLIFTGQVNDVENILPAFDIIISTSKSEGFGRAILEAMACKVPVICAKPSVFEEWILSGYSGYLYRRGNIDELYSLVSSILENIELKEKLIKNAYKRVKMFHDAGKIARKLSEIYRKVA